MRLQENVPLAPQTTLQVGGPARFFVEADSPQAVHDAIGWARSRQVEIFVLGGGSNLLVADAGWPGLVLKIATRGIDQRDGADGKIFFDVGAGESWDGFVARSVAANCAGIECLSGIPGSVGGTPVQDAIGFARSRQVEIFVLGGGSNLLVADAGWPGLVLKIAIRGIDQREAADGKILFEVGAGESWDGFVARSVAANCAGIECLSGIPGSVGGTPVQNVGAYGQEVSDTIESVQVFDLRDNQVRELCAEACGFAYRTSIFNTSERGRFVVLRVTYALVSGGAPRLEYADLKRHFEGRPAPTLAEVREAVLQIRARKGMLIVEGDPDSRSAGSFFKNPVLSEGQHQDLQRRAATKGLIVPSYPALERKRKVSAAWLVEQAGFARGYTLANAGISSKHALALVNRGGATAAEILALKDQIQSRVEEVWGIHLQPEPVFVGL